MRGNAAEHEVMAPGSLSAVLDLIATSPGQWTPIAGGTELMVAFAAGRLSAGKLVSLWDVKELRFIETRADCVVIGAGTTFSDLRASAVISAEFPLLDKAAAWIGAIANQTRATIGGNLVNGSPAADSSPALLVYDAEVELVSVRGKRRIPYCEFHTGYKQNAMTADELMFAVHLPRRFAGHRQYLRKVGTRRAMAISKVALGATALVRDDMIHEVRMAAASLAPYPARLYKTEAMLAGKKLGNGVIESTRRALLAEAQPIDDIRSTAEYRKQVGANLLQEFLQSLLVKPGSQ
jgi:CO/xanthine dehydrogenase FAD-binding subunit